MPRVSAHTLPLFLIILLVEPTLSSPVGVTTTPGDPPVPRPKTGIGRTRRGGEAKERLMLSEFKVRENHLRHGALLHTFEL